MNRPTLKGYIQEALRFEKLIAETLEKRIINKDLTDNSIKDYEDLYRTQGKIQAFNEILYIINKSSKKEGE